MKTRIAMITVVVIAALQLGTAGEPAKKYATTEQKIAYATKNFMIALKTGNVGVMESAMRVAAQMKLKYPEANVTGLKSLFDELCITHQSPSVRYKAYIASNICSDPEWYAQELRLLTANEETFFQAASDRLHQKLFSTNSL